MDNDSHFHCQLTQSFVIKSPSNPCDNLAIFLMDSYDQSISNKSL